MALIMHSPVLAALGADRMSAHHNNDRVTYLAQRQQGFSGRLLLEVLDRQEHFIDVPGNLDATPFSAQNAGSVD